MRSKKIWIPMSVLLVGLFVGKIVFAQAADSNAANGDTGQTVAPAAPAEPAANSGSDQADPSATVGNTTTPTQAADQAQATPTAPAEPTAMEKLKAKYPTAATALALLEAAEAVSPPTREQVLKDLVKICEDAAKEVQAMNDQATAEASAILDPVRERVRLDKEKAAAALKDIQDLRQDLNSLTQSDTAVTDPTRAVGTYK